MNAEHWAADEAKWLDPECELEDIELGYRVSLYILGEQLARRYTPPHFDLSVFQPWGAQHDPKNLGLSA